MVSRNPGSCHVGAEAEVSSLEFRWECDPLETWRGDFAIIGEEANGRCYN